MSASYLRKLALAAAIPAFLATIAPGSAGAVVINTYNGAECEALSGSQAGNLVRGDGVKAKSPTVVVCPIVKNIFNSTAGMTVGPVASAGTSCRLESLDVFTSKMIDSGFHTFPGPGNTALELTIPSSFRGAQQMVCSLGKNGVIRSYGVTER